MKMNIRRSRKVHTGRILGDLNALEKALDIVYAKPIATWLDDLTQPCLFEWADLPAPIFFNPCAAAMNNTPDALAAPPARPEQASALTRAADPSTSHHAARHTAVSASQLFVRGLFQAFGAMTAGELETAALHQGRAAGLRYSASRLRSACAELERAGVLHRVGTRPTGRVTARGHPTHATVWSVHPAPPPAP
jgi:hypothetical protein